MLIFLDIDGVMVPAKSWQNPALLSDGFPAFSDKAVKVLQDMISEDSTIMLTTSHKSRYTKTQWNQIFHSRGIQVKDLHCLNENIHGLSRKDEILHWFHQNVISEDFVIIDDDKSLNALPSFLKERLILTSSMIGLNQSHLLEWRALLDSKSKQVL